jgi:hypothetical protein
MLVVDEVGSVGSFLAAVNGVVYVAGVWKATSTPSATNYAASPKTKGRSTWSYA